MATRLVKGLKALDHTRLAWPTGSNEVFAIVPKQAAQKAKAAGAVFYDWPSIGLDPEECPGEDEILLRLVCSFSTTEEEVDQFLDCLK